MWGSIVNNVVKSSCYACKNFQDCQAAVSRHERVICEAETMSAVRPGHVSPLHIYLRPGQQFTVRDVHELSGRSIDQIGHWVKRGRDQGIVEVIRYVRRKNYRIAIYRLVES